MKAKNSKNTLISILGIILGIVIIVVAITNESFSYHYSGTTGKEEYGGDAYTGIQNACALTANNTYHTFELVQECFQMLFIIIGALVILYYLGKLLESTKSQVVENK